MNYYNYSRIQYSTIFESRQVQNKKLKKLIVHFKTYLIFQNKTGRGTNTWKRKCISNKIRYFVRAATKKHKISHRAAILCAAESPLWYRGLIPRERYRVPVT